MVEDSTAAPGVVRAAEYHPRPMTERPTGPLRTLTPSAAPPRTAFDLAVVGAGAAGLTAAIFAAHAGRRVLLVEAGDDIGGTLHLSHGQMSAGGTILQAARGIADSPQAHYDDVMRLAEGLADPAVVRLAVGEAPAMVDWLLERGLEPLADHPVDGASPGRPGYAVPRYLWARGQGRDILAVLRRELAPLAADGRVQVVTGARVAGLVAGADGGIDGIIATDRDGTFTARARRTVLATGGYAMDRARMEALSGRPAYAALACPTARGDGLDLAVAQGGVLRGHALHRPGTGLVLDSGTWPARVFARWTTAPQLRLPWEIWVDDAGQRFVREDEPLALLRERALLALPRCRFHVVFDAAILAAAPPALEGHDRAALEALCGAHPMFHRADSLTALAAQAGIDAAGLEASVRTYDMAVGGGRDPFGRAHLPRAIAAPPFFAITLHGASATSAVGVTVDDRLRVLRADGSVVPRLHAAGEVLGSGATLGQAFVPGMMLTPALALGRWLGRTLGADP